MEKIVNIGQSITIKGEVIGNEDLTIEGKVDGKIVLNVAPRAVSGLVLGNEEIASFAVAPDGTDELGEQKFDVEIDSPASERLYALAAGTDLLALGETDAVVVAGTDVITESMFGLLDRVTMEAPTELNLLDAFLPRVVTAAMHTTAIRATKAVSAVQTWPRPSAGPAMASAAPPVRHPNVYGIDMPAARELVAFGRSDAEVAAEIGVDWLVYQDLDDLVASAREGNPEIRRFECSVFTGEYITNDVDGGYFERLASARGQQASLQLVSPSDEVVGLYNSARGRD